MGSRSSRGHAVSHTLVSAVTLLLLLGQQPALAAAPMQPEPEQYRSPRDRFIAASFMAADNRYPEAIAEYRQVAGSEPDNAAVQFAIAKSYLALGRLDSARTYGERAVALNPRGRYYLALLAGISHRQKEYARAAELYRQLVDLDPANPELLSFLGMEYLSAGETSEALRVFSEILRLDPANQAARAEVLLLQIKLERIDEAIASLREMIGRGEAGDKLKLTLGELYLRRGEFPLAASALEALLADNPRYVPAWLVLLEVSVRSADAEAFRRDLARFYETLRPDLEKKVELCRFYLGRSARDPLFVDPSFIMIEEVARRHPGKVEPIALLGEANLLHDDPAAAESAFSHAVGLNPSSIELREELVSARIANKDFAGARKTLLLARRRFPEASLRLDILEAHLLFESGEPERAVSLLEGVLQEPVLEQDPRLRLRALGALAFSYDVLGMGERSEPLYRSILSLDPQNVPAMNNLAYLLALDGRELELAHKLAGTAVMSDPRSAVYLDTLGWVLFRMGEYRQSVEILERARAIEPGEAEILQHLSEAYTRLGKRSKAEELQKRLLELR